jgi:hypothetical protein
MAIFLAFFFSPPALLQAEKIKRVANTKRKESRFIFFI